MIQRIKRLLWDIFLYLKVLIAGVISSISFGNKKSADIVLIKVDGIGDFVIWYGYAQKIREFYINRRITLICREHNRELAVRSSFFDEVITVDNYKEAIQKIASLEANILIRPTYSRTFLDVVISFMIKAKKTIEIDGDRTNCRIEGLLPKKEKTIVITPSIAIPEIERHSIFHNKLLHSDERIILGNFENFNTDFGFDFNYFVINLGASQEERRWPVNRFVSVTETINKRIQYACVLIGSKKEVDLSKQFAEEYQNNVINLVGKTSIIETISIIKKASFVICNDTSSSHISAACNTKCFCIAPGYFHPRFTYYPAEKIEGNNNLPLFFMSKNNKCFGCLLYEKKRMTEECLEIQKKHRLYKCIYDIDKNDVSSIINNELNRILKQSMPNDF